MSQKKERTISIRVPESVYRGIRKVAALKTTQNGEDIVTASDYLRELIENNISMSLGFYTGSVK